MSRLLGALLLGCALTAVASDNNSSDPFTITLQRTGCFGSCPIYKVSISSDGSVVYVGKEYVRVKGIQRGKIEPDAAKNLLQDFLDADYFKLEDNYSYITNADGSTTMVTDLPTARTSLTVGARQKTVSDYIGAPKKLKELEEKIDSVSGIKRWVAIDAPSLREEVQRGWDITSADARQLLLDAVRRGDAETVKAFIQVGANVNALIGNVYPLQTAQGVKTVKVLIDAGADVNATVKEYFGPPLSFAAERGDADSIKALLDAGAKVDGRTPSGMTPLMKAAGSGSPEAVQVLLLAGAQSDSRDDEGHGALYYVRTALKHQSDLVGHPEPFEETMPEYESKYKRIEDLLIAAGATNDAPVR